MRTFILSLLIVPALALTACAPDTAPGEPGTSPAASDDAPEGDPAAPAQAARLALAARLGVQAGDIAVEETEARDWSDSCLGLGGPAESCLAVITPGFRILLVHEGTAYGYRTNISGSVVRAEE